MEEKPEIATQLLHMLGFNFTPKCFAYVLYCHDMLGSQFLAVGFQLTGF